MQARWILVIALTMTAGLGMAQNQKLENLALKAKVEATSEFSPTYAAKFVADGIIPKAGLRDSNGKEWAVQGKTHKNGAELTMTWDAPVQIALAFNG